MNSAIASHFHRHKDVNHVLANVITTDNDYKDQENYEKEDIGIQNLENKINKPRLRKKYKHLVNMFQPNQYQTTTFKPSMTPAGHLEGITFKLADKKFDTPMGFDSMKPTRSVKHSETNELMSRRNKKPMNAHTQIKEDKKDEDDMKWEKESKVQAQGNKHGVKTPKRNKIKHRKNMKLQQIDYQYVPLVENVKQKKNMRKRKGHKKTTIGISKVDVDNIMFSPALTYNFAVSENIIKRRRTMPYYETRVTHGMSIHATKFVSSTERNYEKYLEPYKSHKNHKINQANKNNRVYLSKSKVKKIKKMKTNINNIDRVIYQQKY